MLVDQKSPMPACSIGIDVIICYDRLGRNFELEMAILSIFRQTYSPVHVIIITQSFSSADLAGIGEIVGAYDWQERHALPTILSVDAPLGVDTRTHLFNSGIGSLRHRFLAFLDFDDYLYSHAYEHLTQIAQEDEAAVAFGSIDIKYVRLFDSSFYTNRVIRDSFRPTCIKHVALSSFFPVHSFVIDRTRVDTAQLYVGESLVRLDDHSSPLHMAFVGKLSFRGSNKKVGVLNVFLNGSDGAHASANFE